MPNTATKNHRKHLARSHRRTPLHEARQMEHLERLSPGYKMTDAEVQRALERGDRRAELEPYFGEAAYDELHRLAQKARRVRSGGQRALILPGIMGSKLGYPRTLLFDDVIWVDPLDIARGYMADLALPKSGKPIRALGVILWTYLRMKLRLKLAGFDVDFHPYDWRLSIDASGRELKARLLKECGTGANRRDIYLVAHSMGGLVARSAIAQLGSRSDCVRRLIMLGTPNYGSFSPMQVLCGVHDLLQKVAALDLRHDLGGMARNIISTFPGLYQMLPTAQVFSALNLYDFAIWPAGMSVRKDILAKVRSVQAGFAPGDKERMTLIAGVNQPTIVDARLAGGEFEFDESVEGDGTVPLKFAQLEPVKTYYINEAHGSLPSNRVIINAVADLLATGTTDRLREDWSPPRAGITRTLRTKEMQRMLFDGRCGAQLSQSDLRHLADAFAAPLEPERELTPAVLAPRVDSARTAEPVIVGRRRQPRLDIRLALGSITQVNAEAVVLGVFRDIPPGGAAAALDEHLGGAIRELSERRMLAGNVGEIFIMPVGRRLIPADFLVFAGMGRFDEISGEVLKLIAENVARTLIHAQVDHFATVLLGSGSGTDVRSSMANLLEGFFRGIRDTDHHRLHSITLCEIDRARYNLMHSELLQLAATPLFDRFEVTIEEVDLPPTPEVTSLVRAAPPDSAQASYLYVRQVSHVLGDSSTAYQASLLTPSARATVISDEQQVDAAALDRHLESIARLSAAALPEFGAELARMMLSADIVQALAEVAEQGPVIVIHDAHASKVPWETLHLQGESSVGAGGASGKAACAPALAMGISRKYEASDLSIAKWLEERRIDETLNMLLIVNPTGDLPGARREGERVAAMVREKPHFALDVLEGAQATFNVVRAALGSGKYDVVHYAGHAFFEPANRMASGIVCHGRQVFSGADAARLERLPSLMFFNACESGRVRGASEGRARAAIGKRKCGSKRIADNIRTHSSFAEAFLRGGVGNFVGTYWPVGDAEADAFSRVFYGELIEGKAIGDAVLAGRRTVLGLGSTDWANYIHYGSRSFILKVKPRQAGKS